MFWGLFLCNLGELPEKTISPRLTLQREIGSGKKSTVLLLWECIWREGGVHRGGWQEMEKSEIGRVKFQKHLSASSSARLKGTLPHKNLTEGLSFRALVLSRSPSSSPRLRPKACVFISPLGCTTSLCWTPYLISVSAGGSLALSHGSVSGPCWLSREPTSSRPHHNSHCFFTQSPRRCLPRTWPHLNHYLFPHTIKPLTAIIRGSISASASSPFFALHCFSSFFFFLCPATVPGEV